MITISGRAQEVLNQHGAGGGKFLRITVKSGGCAGMTYDAEIDELMRLGEKVVQEDNGIKIISDQSSISYLDGLNIDYSDDLISVGFRFSNSSNESSCGCGASFALAGFPELNKGEVGCEH